jgi:precorrin-6B methylase 2
VSHNNNEKQLDMDTAISYHNKLTADNPTYYHTAFDNKTIDMFDQLFLTTDCNRVLEVGFGSGMTALHMLWQDRGIRYKAIDDDEGALKNMRLMNGWFGEQFAYEIVNSKEYNLQSDITEYGKYDLVILNGSEELEDVKDDIAMAVRSNPKYIFVDNTENLDVYNGIKFYLNQEDFGYRWYKNIMYNRAWFDKYTGNYVVKEVNVSLLEKEEL